MLKNSEFRLQLDGARLPGNESLLLICFARDKRIVQELLFARQLETNTEGE